MCYPIKFLDLEAVVSIATNDTIQQKNVKGAVLMCSIRKAERDDQARFLDAQRKPILKRNLRHHSLGGNWTHIDWGCRLMVTLG